MAKTFTDRMKQKAAVNPTLQFISQPQEAEELTQAEPLPFTPIPGETPEPITESKAKRASASSSSKSRRKASPPPAPAHRAQPNEETKSRRLQLLLTPTLFQAVKECAAYEGISVNEWINKSLWTIIKRGGR